MTTSSHEHIQYVAAGVQGTQEKQNWVFSIICQEFQWQEEPRPQFLREIKKTDD